MSEAVVADADTIMQACLNLADPKSFFFTQVRAQEKPTHLSRLSANSKVASENA